MTAIPPKRRKKTSWKARLGFWIATYSVRWVARLFGAKTVGLLLTPFTRYHYFRRKKDRCKFAKMREVLPAEFWGEVGLERHYFRMLYAWYASHCVSMLYDFLSGENLSKRFSFTGKQPKEYSGEKPLIAVFLHSGAFSMMRVLERSHGMAAATYGNIPKVILSLKKVFRQGDEIYQLNGVPHHLFRGATRELVEFVKPGTTLFIAADGQYDQWSRPIDCGGAILHLNDGAVKLAAKTGAVLIPVWVDQKGAFDFEITYGEPVPEVMLQRKKDTSAALEYLARQFWACAKKNPEALSWTILEAIAPDKKMKRLGWP